MRARILAAVIATASAAIPSYAQGPGELYRGDGYEVVLPSGCEVLPWRATHADTETQPIDCGGRLRAVLVNRIRPTGVPDSARATRVVVFNSYRRGMVEVFGDPDALSAGTEFERPDRVGWRMAVQMDGDSGSLRGIVEVSFARGDNRRAWNVMYLDRTPDAETAATGERIIDSFRITGGDGPPAEVRGTKP